MEEVKEQIGRMPRIGEPAPVFEAATTPGTLKLEDFKGSCIMSIGRCLTSETNNLLARRGNCISRQGRQDNG
jgi:hypothetical protein